MPLLRCQEKGKEGWKWGEEGDCFIDGNDKENKEAALAQGFAIAISMTDNIQEARELFNRELNNA